MHEMSFCIKLVNLAIETAQREQAKRVVELSVLVGEMTGIVDQLFINCYEKAVEGTILEGAKLNLIHDKTRAYCNNCGTEFIPDKEHDYLCPKCGGFDCKITGGRGVVLKEIILD